MAIRILVTGGTFDKEYNERTGQLYFKDTHISGDAPTGACEDRSYDPHGHDDR